MRRNIFQGLFLLGLVGSVFIYLAFSAGAQTEEYEFQTTNVFPGAVDAVGWENAEEVSVQDFSEDAMFGGFSPGKAAHVVSFEDTLPTGPGGASSESPPTEPPAESPDGGDGTAPTEPTEQLPLEEQVPDIPEETPSVPEEEVPESPADEPPTETPPESPPAEDSASAGGGFKLATLWYRLANAVTDLAGEDVADAIPEEVIPIDLPNDEVPSPADLAPEPAIAGESDPSPDITSLEPPKTTSDRETTLCPTEYPECEVHELLFTDFGVGDGFEHQQIVNSQLRLSFAARPHDHNEGNREEIIIEYFFEGEWINAGVIPITEEVSNASNGGYLLYALPLFDAWEIVEDLQVRVSYVTDSGKIGDVYLDSLWIEVESIDEKYFWADHMFNREVPVAQSAPEPQSEYPFYFDRLTDKFDFRVGERPMFKFRYERKQGFFEGLGTRVMRFFGNDEYEDVSVKVLNGDFAGYARVWRDGGGEFTVDIQKMRRFKPGKHVLELLVTDGDREYVVEQEFTWGVLAINVNKSIYKPDERAYVQMGVLDDLGHTICDAKLDLVITDPSGGVRNFSTDDGSISYGEECAGDTYTTSPDYSMYYNIPMHTGTYRMQLTSTVGENIHVTESKFEVRDAVPFDIERAGPTRIYPPEPYPVILRITAHEDYEGVIEERVPQNFQVFEPEGTSYPFRTHEVGDVKSLYFNVSIQAGETIELPYLFDAPNVSPEFYLLGPLSIGGFAEIREWQIASDAPVPTVASFSYNDASATDVANVVVTAPSGIQDGDLLIGLLVHDSNTGTLSPPAGFTALHAELGTSIDYRAWYKVANGESGNYTFTTSNTDQMVGAVIRVTGVDPVNPINVVASGGGTSANPTSPTANTTRDDTKVFRFYGIDDDDFTEDTGYPGSHTGLFVRGSAGATGEVGLGAAHATQTNQGATGAASFTVDVVDEEWQATTVAVNPVQEANVSSIGNQTELIQINTTNNYVGGAFSIALDANTATVTAITITENGTVDAQNDLSNIRLRYEMDTVAPYDCASVSYDGTEAQFGATSTSFSSANGTSTFNGNVLMSSTSAMCVYTILDVDSSTGIGDTLEIEIDNPSVDVDLSIGTTEPNTSVLISDTTLLHIGYVPLTPNLADTPAFPYQKSTTTMPTFGGFAATDQDGDVIEYEFTIDDDINFGSPATTTLSSHYPSDSGWASTTFASGATTTYRIQEALTPGVTYWWRVRARDPFNRNEWSSSTPPRSITISNTLTVPEWTQTTDEQFATGTTFTNATTTGSDSVTIASTSASVSLLDAWTTGNTKTISSGSDRLLVVAVMSEDSGTSVNVNTVTYGGQTLTQIDDQQIGTGFANGTWFGYLDEAGIQAAVGTTITPTWTGGTPDNGILYSSAVFSGVNQTSPVRDNSGNVITTGATIQPTAAVSVVDGDMMVYVSVSGSNGLTHTPSTGYTEGTEQDAGGNAHVGATAYKAITADGTEQPTATWSASGNRVSIIAASIRPASPTGVIMSEPVDFDWVSNQNDWGEILWSVTEPAGTDTTLRLYYSSSTACDTIVPNGALAGNSTGFGATSSPVNISGLSTSTYNRICLQMTLDQGTATSSPTLDDWGVSWVLKPIYDQERYRWYANTNNILPTDIWPPTSTSSDLAENAPIDANNPTKTGDVLRLRSSVLVSSVAASGDAFKLQYAAGDTCSADMTWRDVGDISSSTAEWRGYNNAGVSDGATIGTRVLSTSDVSETYEEENNSSAMPNSISVGQEGEWDWVLENRALPGTPYCFRMAKTDGSALNTYSVYPAVVTNSAGSVTLEVPFDNEKIASTSPWFEFVGVDTEGEDLHYQIQIDNNADFSSTIIDTNSETNLTDFTNLVVPSDKAPFTHNQTIEYRTPAVLSNGTTYWWRVRAKDPTGSNTYGDWSSSRSLTVDTGVVVSTWFQTTADQFLTDTLVGVETVSNALALISGSTTGTTTSPEIDFDWATIGNAWGELSFNDTETSGDIKYHIEYYDGADWALIPDGDLAGNAAGFDTSPVSLIDLNTVTYNQIRVRANFTNSGGSPSLQDWTVSWGQRVAVPTHLKLFDNEATPTTTPSFEFTTTDPENDDLEYEISWSTDNTFVGASTTRRSGLHAGFLNITNGGDTNPFTSGHTIRFTVQPADALTASTTYWWRVRARDPLAGNSYSFWSSPWSFTTDGSVEVSTWYQTTEEQFETDSLVGLVASSTDSVSTIPAGISTYTFAGITNPSATHIARDFEVDVLDPEDPPSADDIDTLTNSGTSAGTPNLRTGIALYQSDAEATNAQYTNISTSNNVRWQITDPGAGDNAVFWASMVINENPDDITQIDVLLEGYQAAAANVAWLGIWRPGASTPYWEELSHFQATSDSNYTGSITTNIEEYLDSNNRIHIIFFNENVSNSLFVDYVEIKTTSVPSSEGTLTSQAIDFNDGTGPLWGQMYWTDSEPGGSTLMYQLEYLTATGTWALIPDSALPFNSTGTSTFPVNLRPLNTTLYNEIRVVGNFTCNGINCPTLNDFTLEWSRGFDITGTAHQYNQTSSTTSGTVAVAVNGVLQSGKTGTIQSNGTWTIPNVTVFAGDVVTVFIDGAADADEAVAVSVYDGSPDLPGFRLYQRHLSIGSDDLAVVSNANLGEYDFTDDEDLFFDVDGGNDLNVCATTGCDDAEIIILSGNTYQPGTGGDVRTHDIEINGTFAPGNNTVRVSGSWDNNGTLTAGGSTVIMTATSTTETVDSTGAATSTFNNLTFGETSGTATWQLLSALDVDGNLSITRGTLNQNGARPINLAGNLTIGANGLFVKGAATTTFDGTGTKSWTDSTAVKQDMGIVVVDGTSEILELGSNVALTNLTIGADDILSVTGGNYDITVYGNWTNNNVFSAFSGEVIFAATTTNRVITDGSSAFYDLTFNGAGGSWSFADPLVSVNNTLAIATGTVTLPTGTTTISGSFLNTGGIFAHNNATISFIGAGSKSITANGTAFLNAFYNLVFNGAGSWTFTDTNATTSNDLTISAGTVTMPSGTFALGGSLIKSGGTIAANNGTLQLTSSAAETVQTGGSSLANLLFSGSGSWSFVDANVTATGNVTISAGSATLPSGTFTIGGSFTNSAAFAHNSGTVLFNSTTTGRTITSGGSSFANVNFNSATGGWTIGGSATSTGTFSLSAASSFTLASSTRLSVGGTFTNSVGGASTTWTGSELFLYSGTTYAINTKTNAGDFYGSFIVASNTDVSMWYSSSTSYTIDPTGSLYSQDHSGVDGDLYVFGEYVRTSGTEHWSYATDFDGTALGGGRQVDVRFASGSTAGFINSTLSIIGTGTASTTVAAQSGTYTLSVTNGTTSAAHYRFADLGATGLSLVGSTTISSLSDGAFAPATVSGSGITVSSTTIDANPAKQIFRIEFATTTGISAFNVAQTDGAPSSYWWFRNTSGNLDGEAYDNDTGDPGSIRWDDSSLVVTASGTVYSDVGLTPMGAPTCDGVTQNIRLVVEGGATYNTTCNPANGQYVIPGVAIVGDPTITVFLNTNGGARAVTVTKTVTENITDLNLYQNRVITRHEDTDPLSIADMVSYDEGDDTDIPFIAATGTPDTLMVRPDTELLVLASTTFTPGGNITLQSGGTGNAYDGTLHIDNNATFTAVGTESHSVGGRFLVDAGAVFTPASSTVTMTATTTNKIITTPNGGTINFNDLSFTGVGGGWPITANINVAGNMSVATGTVSGTGNITLPFGSLSGNGLLTMTSGTTTIERTNTLGGTQGWTFNNLVLGNGSFVGTTTRSNTATTTILGRLTVATGHTLGLGSAGWDLRGGGVPLVINGVLDEGTSLVRYSASTSASIVSTTYHHLDLNAESGSPTYTAVGSGVLVNGNLTVGGGTQTTVNFNTNDPALAVVGDMFVRSTGTFTASNATALTVSGSYENDGTFTSSGGSLFFDGIGTHTIRAGASSFGNLEINGAGSFTVAEHATTTGTFMLANAGSFTLSPSVALAVGGVFTNDVGGGATTWTGSTLSLYSGSAFSINASTTADQYGTLSIGANTDVRMWNSHASSTLVNSSGSLYSQDHANADGDLYIYGDYVRTSGSDYWSYATDFDGTALGGSSREVAVFVASGAAVTVTGGSLEILGSATASTTITNQGSGTYAFTIGGTATINAQYYELRNLTSAGWVFTGTPSVTTLSYGDIEVGQTGYSGMTVGSTAINQNPAKTFTGNRFATSTGVASAFNVTATGTSVSSWRFTNATGNIAGESFDNDPGGDPGYIVWDDSNALISISGNVYADEVPNVSGVCDGATNNIRLVVGGVTATSTTCNAGTGAYSFTGVGFSAGDSLIVYIDGEAEKAASVTEDPISSIAGFNLYENRVVVRHEDTDPISIADMAVYDSSDDADIPFTAVDAGSDTLTLPANRKLIVWTGKTFAPNGNVTVTGGGGGADYDGTLELQSNAVFTASSTESHTIGGSFLTGTGASLTPAQSTFTFTTPGSGRSIDINNGSFYNLTLNGSGSWGVVGTSVTALNDFTISSGSVTLPTGTTTIGGSLNNTGGSFAHASGTVFFNSTTGGETVRAGGSSFNTLTFNGTGGTWTFQDTNATTTGAFTIGAGAVTLPSGVFAVAGAFDNAGGTFTHNSGTVRLTATTTGTTLRPRTSDFNTVTMAGSGSYTMMNQNVTLLGNLNITQGSMTFATGTLSIGGSLNNTGGSFAHASGTVLFNSTDTGETVNVNGSSLNNVSFASPTGGWTMTNHATTTGTFTLSSASSFTLSPSMSLAVGGVFTNLVGGASTTWDGSTLSVNSGTGYTINTKAAGGDRYNTLVVGANTDLRLWNSSATTTSVASSSSLYSQDHAATDGSLYIFGDYIRTAGVDYWSYATDFDGAALGGGSRAVTVAIAGNATATIDGATLNMIGGSGATTTITNQGSGTYALIIDDSTINARYYALRNANADGLQLTGLNTVTSLIDGDFELAVAGGSLITVSSTTVNANAAMTITNVRFATTTAISGFNVELSGTTPNAWTFSGHSGNLDGEDYDIDGGDACGSIRWGDSVCLLVDQSHYRWRNDDGGESVPNSEWYDSNWDKRKRIEIANNDATLYTSPVVKLTIPYDADMQSDFDDLRFTDSSGTALIPYWRETYVASNNATVWVRIPSLPASGYTTVYAYYANAGATDGSNGTTTFDVFDNFEDDNITEYSGDTSLFNVGTNFAYERTYGLDAFGNESQKTTDGIYNTSASSTVSQGDTIRYLQYIDTSAGSGDETCTLFGVQSPGSNNQNYAVCLELFGTDRVSISENVSSNDTSGTVLASSSMTFITGWHEVEVDWRTDNVIFVSVYRDGSLVATTTATDGSYTTGGIGFSFWFQNGGWDIYTSRPYLATEPSYVVSSAEQTDGGATWKVPADTPNTGAEAGTPMRLRFAVSNTGPGIIDQNFRLEFAEKDSAPSCESVSFGDYAAVPPQSSCGSSPFCMEVSSNFLNGDPTTDLLSGNGSVFVPGAIIEDPSNSTADLDIDNGEYTEVEYILEPTVNATAPAYCFRVSDGGSDLDSYTKVAELSLQYDPTVLSWSLNNGQDIVLSPGTTTAVYATGTVSDNNGYADILSATSTFYRSFLGPACTPDNNNCYQLASSSCSFSGCSGNSCNVSCVADIYFFADPTDPGSAFSAQDWRADLFVVDALGGSDTQSTIGSELLTLRAIDVNNSIDYGALSVNSDTGSYTPTTTVENIGNDSIDVNLSGTDLSNGVSSVIPVTNQKYATTTFTYGACTVCGNLSTTPSLLEVDLSKPTTTTPVISDDIFWGINIPFGVAATAHQGVNTFMATGD